MYKRQRLSSDLVGSSLLSDVNTEFLNPVQLLYQSGYLTIKGFDPRFKLYTLGFPNMEVKDGFLNLLLGYYAPIQSDSTNTLISLMSMDVESGDVYKRQGYNRISGRLKADYQVKKWLKFSGNIGYVHSKTESVSYTHLRCSCRMRGSGRCHCQGGRGL